MTTFSIELPALDGRTPLGFLAALGLLRVCADVCRMPTALSFSDSTACAILHSPCETAEEIAEALRGVIESIPESAILPDGGAGFPPPSGVGKDPLRRSREEFHQLATNHPEAAETWLPSLVTDLALDKQERCAITLFTAPSGKQTLQTFFAKPLEAVRGRPERLLEALVGWRRVEGVTGEYLDHRVLRSNSDDPEGRAGRESGVPGATWLATMALPLLRITGDGQRVRTTLWHRRRSGPVMLWPLWRPALNTLAVRCLLEHPVFAPVDHVPTVSSTHWPALGVINVYGAERQRIPGRTFDGVLSPLPVKLL
ncbi:hypothetical protein OG884_25260 [Streptosporangium sp. NBC_01755]|uniref:type I-G CRISPR-associated protein, Cas3-extension family n=1 Tax=Streptosporangium sp. NBC_01755 TaxID=2975949 RepID=UPI002DDBD8B0|nr:hypothetical protein [Streptosporangium sp. NBC_01755]WSC98178.1 hypothetical protein OG884_25260 [Streptosporangium sp. NBC_01755]